MGKVILSPQPVKTSVRLDYNGNEIDPRTKQILVPREVESVEDQNPPLPEPQIAPPVSPIVKDDPMDIQKQIEQAEANLIKLKEAKKTKIEEMKKLLSELEK